MLGRVLAHDEDARRAVKAPAVEDRTPLDAEVVDGEDRLIGVVGDEGTVRRPHISRTELAHRSQPSSPNVDMAMVEATGIATGGFRAA